MRTSSTERARKWRLSHTEEARAHCRAQYQKNKDKRKAYYAKWRAANKGKINQYNKQRKATDPQFRVGCALRTRIWMAIKQNTKKGSSIKDLGCSIPDLLTYLASKFEQGMTWDNYGEWHIDHVKPLASFDLQNRAEFLKACHYTNLQPLWAADNIRKSDT